MGENGEGEQQLPRSSTSSEPSRFNIRPPRPPRPYMESHFNDGSLAIGGFSAGPMTPLPSFYADNGYCNSFSPRAMASPATFPVNRGGLPPFVENISGEFSSYSGFMQSRPPSSSITYSSALAFTPRMSPGVLPDPPGFFFPPTPFGMTHQQVLPQVTTAHAAQANSHIHFEDQYSSLSFAQSYSSTQPHNYYPPSITPQQMPPLVVDSGAEVNEPSNHDYSYHPPSSSFIVDEPPDDGYNWRKYGRHIPGKGSEFTRGYYKCTHPNCPMKKKTVSSAEGHITQIIYSGHHDHEPPAPKKRGRDTGNGNEDSNLQDNFNVIGGIQSGSINETREGMVPYSLPLIEQESSRQATAEHLLETADGEKVENAVDLVDEEDDEPDPKRRNTETVPKIILQTTSEKDDVLEDGYRWHKYGIKNVKGKKHPRTYYRCATPGCNVRKLIERDSTDPKDVITTYEGRHNHVVPPPKRRTWLKSEY